MSDLEEESKPLLGCLLQDVAMPLDQSQQRTIALWAIKTAMVSESIGTPGCRHFTPTWSATNCDWLLPFRSELPFGLAATLVP
jgi:hypothetical protein